MMEFNQQNPIVKYCLQGMNIAPGNRQEAESLYLQAWAESADDHEKFIAAYFVAHNQENTADRLHWLATCLQFALKINDDRVLSAIPVVYKSIAKCYEESGEQQKANENYNVASNCKIAPTDKGPFYHGTKAVLKVGDLLIAGGKSNYAEDFKMNHIYFTAVIHGAGLAAALAKGDGPEHIYLVQATGEFENDPNVTNKKFPGNPTCSYRSTSPLKIIEDVTGWMKLTAEEVQQWREKLAKNDGEIIN